jgi:concanavalin A-like lectin/glucanase superfamily protein
MFKVLKYNNKLLLKNLFIASLVAVVLFSIFFYFNKNNLLVADENTGENFGGWSSSALFGWTSESCNNLYGGSYDDYCRIEIDSILDISFDANNIDIDNNLVEDNASSFDGTLFNFVKTDIRNGGRGRSSGIVKRDSNFDNSLYFNGVNSYINFGSHSELSFSDSDFAVSLWFKIDPNSSGTRFLFSNGNDIDERYHCWIDTNNYLFCIINNQELRSSAIIDTERWNNVSIVNEIGIFSMYLNGSSRQDVSTGFVSGPPGVEDLILGANGNHVDNFKGELDEFRFFDVALSADQVLQNTKYNSDYLLNIEDGSGVISGWVWSSGIGWICLGGTCLGTDPDGNIPEAKLHWFSEGGNIYPHMITGWANAVVFNDPGQPYPDAGWMSLQSDNIKVANHDKYDSCVSCGFRDEENELVLYLKMDEDDGLIATDSSGFTNNGDLIDFVDPEWLNEGKVNNCLVFDGEDDYIDVDVTVNEELELGLSDFSIEAWVKNEELEHELPDHLSIISGKTDQNWELYFDSTRGYLIFEIFGKFVEGKALDISDWSHVVVVANRFGNLEMYINNIKYDEVDISPRSGQYIKNGNFFIGKDDNGSFWDDKIDIIRIYRRALSEEEIDHNYKFPEKRFCSACLSQTLDTVVTDNICYECERCELISGITDCEVCSSCRQYGLVFDSNTANIKGYAWGGNTVDDEFVGLGWFKFSPESGVGFYRSYVSTKYGSIYSRGNIGSDYTIAPPTGNFNATYMIQTNGHIINWISGKFEEDPSWHMSENFFNYSFPELENDYGNVLGNLDYLGLTEGIYGEREFEVPDKGGSNFNVCLDDKVYFIEGEDVILPERSSGMAYKFENCSNAAGTIIVDGDLTIEGNIDYADEPFSGSSDNLASVTWIIKGDLKISPDVERLAGTFIVLGEDGVNCGSDLEDPVESCGAIFTCDGDPAQCNKRLDVSGQFLAKNLRFGRTFRSLIGGDRDPAEEIVYDGRNVINPSPGLGDVLKSLPTWNQIAPY